MKFSIGAQTKVVPAILSGDCSSEELIGKFISFADSAKICVVAIIAQDTTTPVKLGILQAKDNTGTDAKAIKNDAVIWANEDAGTLDYCTRQENAKEFTTNAEPKGKVIVMEIQPSVLDEGFKYIAVKASPYEEAADVTVMAPPPTNCSVCAFYILPCLRYAQNEALNVLE